MPENSEFVDELDRDTQSILLSLVGREWRGFYASETPGTPNNFTAWESVGVQLDDSCLAIRNNFNDLKFQDEFEDDIGHLSIALLASFTSSVDDVKLHMDFAGQHIRGLYVVRASVRSHIRNTLTWTLSSDYGVVFELDAGCVAVTKSTYGGIFLRVSTATSLAGLDLSEASSFWTDDQGDIDDPETGERYEAEFALVPVSGLEDI